MSAPTWDELMSLVSSIARLEVEKERNECARICEMLLKRDYSGKFLDGYMSGVEDCIKAIRDRG